MSESAKDGTVKRRGRPRLSDDERKRHTMTFRMRDDLRAAVEEVAHGNGRSLSEQIEYYIEACISSEVAVRYTQEKDQISPVLLKAVKKVDAIAPAGALLPLYASTGVSDEQKKVSSAARQEQLKLPAIEFLQSEVGRTIVKDTVIEAVLEALTVMCEGAVRLGSDPIDLSLSLERTIFHARHNASQTFGKVLSELEIETAIEMYMYSTFRIDWKSDKMNDDIREKIRLDLHGKIFEAAQMLERDARGARVVAMREGLPEPFKKLLPTRHG